MANNRKIKIIIFLLIAVILTTVALLLIKQKYPNKVAETPKTNPPLAAKPTPKETETPNSKFIIPDSIFLPVPFTPQAPTANWDELHNEACEEASAIMAAEYFSSSPGKEKIQAGANQKTAADTLIDPKTVESEIQKLSDWQQQNFGYHLSINTAETARMIKEVYGLETEIIKNFTADDIKKALSQNKLVLFPANGRLLYNPNFKSPGPKYHMLLIKGYSDASVGTPTSQGASEQLTTFITNDPGTKKGLNYPYTFDVLYASNGDYDHQKAEVDLNTKMIIVVEK